MGRVHKKRFVEASEENSEVPESKKSRKDDSDVDDAKSNFSDDPLASKGKKKDARRAGKEEDLIETNGGTSAASKKNSTKSGKADVNDSKHASEIEDDDPLVTSKKLTTKKPKGKKPPKEQNGDGDDDNGEVGSDASEFDGPIVSKKTEAKGKKGKGKKQKPSKKSESNDDSVEDEEDEEYEVQNVVGKKLEKNVVYYLIRWKGYTAADDTWEAEDTLNCPELIEKFLEKDSQKEGKKSSPAKSRNGKKSNEKKAPTDPEKEWEVEKIIDFASKPNGENLYRVRWRGYRPKDDTWEPERNLNCPDLVEKFMKRIKSQEHISFKELREEPKKTKRLVNETAPRTNLHNAIGRSSKRSQARKR